jgi:hypothetical protein
MHYGVPGHLWPLCPVSSFRAYKHTGPGHRMQRGRISTTRPETRLFLHYFPGCLLLDYWVRAILRLQGSAPGGRLVSWYMLMYVFKFYWLISGIVSIVSNGVCLYKLSAHGKNHSVVKLYQSV